MAKLIDVRTRLDQYPTDVLETLKIAKIGEIRALEAIQRWNRNQRLQWQSCRTQLRTIEVLIAERQQG